MMYKVAYICEGKERDVRVRDDLGPRTPIPAPGHSGCHQHHEFRRKFGRETLDPECLGGVHQSIDISGNLLLTCGFLSSDCPKDG